MSLEIILRLVDLSFPSESPNPVLTIMAERTFLAWLRTSLSFASIGIAVTQLFRLNSSLSDPQKGGRRRAFDGNFASSSTSPADLLSQDQYLDTREVSLADKHHLRHVGKPLGATFLAVCEFTEAFPSQCYIRL